VGGKFREMKGVGRKLPGWTDIIAYSVGNLLCIIFLVDNTMERLHYSRIIWDEMFGGGLLDLTASWNIFPVLNPCG